MHRKTASRLAPVTLASLDYKIKPTTSTFSSSTKKKGSIMACHGLLGSGEKWKNFAFKLSKHRRLEELNAFARVQALDMRNHGRSPHTQQHTCALIATDIENHILRQHQQQQEGEELSSDGDGGSSSLLIAHSMSGYATMHSLIRQANRDHYLELLTTNKEEEEKGVRCGGLRHQRVDRLLSPAIFHNSRCPSTAYSSTSSTIASTVGEETSTSTNNGSPVKACVIIDVCPSQAPPQTFPDILHDLDAMRTLPLHAVASMKEAYEALKGVVKNEEELRSHLFTNFFATTNQKSSGQEQEQQQQAAGPSWRANLSVLLHDLHHVVLPDHPDLIQHRVQIPTLFVFGQDSPYNTKEGRAKIDLFFANAVQVEIPNCGHFVHIERRDLLADIVADFAAEHVV